MLRLLHFSDVHVDMPFGQLPLRSMFNKRAMGAANLLLRRAKRFAGATRKLEQLAEFAREQHVDGLLCTGDYTVLGTEPEFRAARAAMEPLIALDLPFATVPGNHDVYMPDARRDRRFERHFGTWTRTDCPELSTQAGWPWVRLLGDTVAAVGINSARPNPQPWRSSGRIADGEMQQLEVILADPRLRDRFVLVLTHYAPRRPDGSPDTKSHGLENAEDLLATCRKHSHIAVLHGHIHRRLALEEGGVHLLGAGSTTDLGREGLWMFEIDGHGVRARPGGFHEGRYKLTSDPARILR